MQKLLSLISLIFNKTSSNMVPSRVGDYVLQSPIHKNRANKRYATGIYKKGNKRVFIKTWSGSLKNFDYFSLENEIRVSKLLASYTTRLQLTSLMNVPRIISVFKAENQLSIIFEYIEGKSVSKLSVTKQVEIINNVITALYHISTKISPKDRAAIPTRSALWHLEVFFPKLIKSNFALRAKWQLLTVVVKSYLALPSAITHTQKLAHGDLLPQNIILKNKKVYVVDYGQTSFTLPGYDLVYIATQRNISALISKLLPHGLVMTQVYIGNIVAALSAVSADALALQDYFFQCVCG